VALAAVVIGAAPAGAASWFPLNSETDKNLEALQFPVDDLTGYAAGAQGTILKTTDGGATWVAQTSGSAAGLRGMCFLNNSTGFVVGSGGEILRTDDGGETWSPQTSGTTEVLRDVKFPVDDQTGYVVGDNGTILKTVNGGATWTPQDSSTSLTLLGVDFPVDDQTGYAAGWAGEMVKTTDGGANWSGLNTGSSNHQYDVHFPVDTQTGYICGNQGEVWVTTDGGSNWTMENSTAGAVLYDLCFQNATNGYAVGFSGDIVKRTSEGWWSQNAGHDDRLYDIEFPGGGSIGYAVGWYGVILKTTDGGGEMVVLHPRGDGSISDFTTWFNCPAGTWDCVNDQTGNAASGTTEPHDDNTTYLTDSKPNTNREMFALDDGLVPSGATVNSIEIIAQVGKTGGPPPTASLCYQRIGTDPSPVDATPVTVGSAPYNQEISASWSCLNWTATDIDNLEIGIYHVSGADLSITQIRVRVSYDSTGTVYRSIGTEGAPLYSVGTASIGSGSRTVTFGGGAVLPSNVGAGDFLTIGDAEFHIRYRVSDTQVTVQEIPCTDYADLGYTIERAYNTLQAWEDDRGGDLVADDRLEVGVVYNDGPFTGRLTISGSTTDASHYMRLTVADGQGHQGLMNTGAVIDAQGGWGGSNAIDVEDEYTRIEGLEIKAIQDAGSAVYFSGSPAADNGLVDGIFVHSCWQNGNAGVDIGAVPVTVRNSFFTGGTTYGIRVLASATGIVENCTIVGTLISGVGISDSVLSTISVSNTISVNHPTDNDFALWSNISFFGNNMYSGALGIDPPEDDGGHQAPPADLEDLFVSFAGYDFHLEASGHDAGGNGLDLSASFTNDIDGDTRVTPWDIGADDDTSGGGGGGPPPTPSIISWREIDPY
jgi:photosystem II stability/assembly factor-like uncharacterized protein